MSFKAVNTNLNWAKVVGTKTSRQEHSMTITFTLNWGRFFAAVSIFINV